MRIADIKAHVFTPLKLIERDAEPFSLIDWSRLSWGRGDAALITVTTDEGIEGYFGGSPEAAEHLIANKQSVIGADPYDRIRLQALIRGPHGSATALDVCLWDIAGKALGLPIHKLLGSCRDNMPAYASFIQLPTLEAFVELALDCQKRGYKALKIHPYWGGDWKKDIDLCRAVREAVGDEMTLMLDPCMAYDRFGAMKVGRVLDELGFYWYEDPLPESDIEGYVDLCRSLDVALAEAEASGLRTQAEFVRRSATDILKCGFEAGITGVMKASHLAQAFDMKCEPHSWGTALEQASCLHAMLAMPNCTYFEVPVPEGIMDQISKEVIRIDEKGKVHAPTAPGVGLEVDFDAIDRALVKTL